MGFSTEPWSPEEQKLLEQALKTYPRQTNIQNKNRRNFKASNEIEARLTNTKIPTQWFVKVHYIATDPIRSLSPVSGLVYIVAHVYEVYPLCLFGRGKMGGGFIPVIAVAFVHLYNYS